VRWPVGDYFFCSLIGVLFGWQCRLLGIFSCTFFSFFSFISPLLLAHFSFRLVRINPLVQALRFVLSKSSPISFFVLRWFYWMMRLRREGVGHRVLDGTGEKNSEHFQWMNVWSGPGTSLKRDDDDLFPSLSLFWASVRQSEGWCGMQMMVRTVNVGRCNSSFVFGLKHNI